MASKVGAEIVYVCEMIDEQSDSSIVESVWD